MYAYQTQFVVLFISNYDFSALILLLEMELYVVRIVMEMATQI